MPSQLSFQTESCPALKPSKVSFDTVVGALYLLCKLFYINFEVLIHILVKSVRTLIRHFVDLHGIILTSTELINLLDIKFSDWQKSSTWKRRQTSSDSISYVVSVFGRFHCCIYVCNVIARNMNKISLIFFILTCVRLPQFMKSL